MRARGKSLGSRNATCYMCDPLTSLGPEGAFWHQMAVKTAPLGHALPGGPELTTVGIEAQQWAPSRAGFGPPGTTLGTFVPLTGAFGLVSGLRLAALRQPLSCCEEDTYRDMHSKVAKRQPWRCLSLDRSFHVLTIVGISNCILAAYFAETKANFPRSVFLNRDFAPFFFSSCNIAE